MQRDLVLAGPEARHEASADLSFDEAARDGPALAAARTAIDRLPRRTLDILEAVRVDGQDPRDVGAAHNITREATEAHISWALQVMAVRVFNVAPSAA